MKILSASQIRDFDAYTIRNEPVLSIDLMERACRAFVHWFVANFDTSYKVGIVCGTGNNGGDGLGIARILHDWGYAVRVWVVRGSVSETEDFKVNLSRVQQKITVDEIVTEADQGLFTDVDVMVDSIFGSGLSRPPSGIYAQAINCINNTKAVRVSVDIPSGLMADKPSEGPVVRADYTLTFQVPKLSFFLPGSYAYTGEWRIEDIGLHRGFLKGLKTDFRYVLSRNVARILRRRKRFDHKGDYGHALLVAGSFGKMGAALLSARAALRAGTGLLTVHAPGCGNHILQTAVPEAMVSTDPEENIFKNIPETERYSTIGIGPGLGKDPETVRAFRELLSSFRKPMVIDADALNMLSEQRDLLKLVPPGSILTPHPKEFSRLVGEWNDDFERLAMQRKLASEIQSTVVLKGAFTSIADPDGMVYFNSTGNPGMATGGTGDVLTGILTGLLAQSYSGTQAAVLGVYLHGMAGDEAAIEKGMDSLIASDLIDFLPQAFKKIISS